MRTVLVIIIQSNQNGSQRQLTHECLLNYHKVIYFSGIGGIGKSTALKHLALSWAKGRPELQKFDLVFHIALKDVNHQTCLGKLILLQHKGLIANNVTEQEMSELLDGKCKRNILILIDGFDEYRTGTNSHIDSVLNRSNLWDSWIILTSRPFDKLDLLKQYFDAEATIIGFSDDSICSYASTFLESKEIGGRFLEIGKRNQIMDILSIPLILQMMCVLFKSGQDLPKSKTQATRAIVDWSIKYSTYRKSHTSVKSRQVDHMLYKLGKLAWKSLQGGVQQLLLSKVSDIMITQLIIIE